MSKVSRGALKQLVKECLFEILLESTDSQPSKLVEARKKTRSKTRRAPTPRPALDSIVIGGASKQQKKDIDVSNITTDPVMAAIFQDTAATTLMEQAAAERGRPVGENDYRLYLGSW